MESDSRGRARKGRVLQAEWQVAIVRILSFSSSLPSAENPGNGIFVLRRLLALAKLADVDAIHPVPWFPGYPAPIPRPSRRQEQVDSLKINHLRFLYLPGILKRLDGWFYYRGLLPWVRGHIATHGAPDIFDAHFAWPDGVGVSYLARRVGLPYSITLRGTINPRCGIAGFRERMSDALRHAAVVMSVSEDMAEIATRLGVARDRVHVIPNGVDTSQFLPIPRPDARKRLGLAADTALIVCVASLKPAKGHEDLIEAASRLPEHVHVLIVGPETDHGGYLRCLKRSVCEKSLSHRFTFVGSQPPSKIALYLNAADLSVLPSHSEGCPNVVLESLACGTPVVATGVGAIPAMVRSRENGELVPVGDPGALAEAIGACLSREWSRTTIAETVSPRSWDVVGGEVLRVLEAAVADRRPDR